MTAQPLPSPSGARERQKAETRARVLAAARDLFVSKGFDATRPQDIARAAGVAVGTFYVHFADKRAAFLAVTEQAADDLMGRIAESAAPPGAGFAARLRESLDALFDFSADHPGLLAACFADASVISAGLPSGASLRDRLARRLADGLRRGMERGELHADYDAEIVAAGIVGLVQHAFLHGGEPDRRVCIDNVTRFCERALAKARPEEIR